MSAELGDTYTRLAARNPRVDAERVRKLLDYVADLQRAGIDVESRYELSPPFEPRRVPGVARVRTMNG